MKMKFYNNGKQEENLFGKIEIINLKLKLLEKKIIIRKIEKYYIMGMGINIELKVLVFFTIIKYIGNLIDDVLKCFCYFLSEN